MSIIRCIGFVSSIVLLVALSHSCKEVGPNINLADDVKEDTTYVTTEVESPQDKIVLLEEFTGVRCVNCPKGHELIDDIKLVHSARFIAISEHSEFLAEPYNNDQDLRAEEAQDLEDMLGPAFAKPSGTIDRKLFPGETQLLQFTAKWAGYVDQQITETTPVNVHIVNDYSNTSRKLSVTITLHYTSEVTDENKLTVMVLEDGILTSQLDDHGVDSAYIQNQVLRRTLTAFNGIVINTTKERGRVFVKSFVVEELPIQWVAANVRIVALVHKSVGSFEVLQAAEATIQ